MNRKSVKIGQQYLYQGSIVTVIKAIKGKIDKRSYNSIWVGLIRKPIKFKLNTGEIVNPKLLCQK